MIRLIRIRWLRWRRDAAIDELQMFQARFDVGPLYLVNVMRHANHLERQIAALQ